VTSVVDRHDYDALVEVWDAMRSTLDGIPTGRLVLASECDGPVGRVVRDYLMSL
jgi:hypothetical protein